MFQNVSFQLDHSLEKFSIQSRYQKLSASLNKSRLPIVAFGGLVGVGWGFLACVVLFLQTAANFYQGPPDFSFDSPWVRRMHTTCHRSWHWEGCKRGHRLCSFWDRKFCSQTGREQCAPTLSSAAKSSLFQLSDRKEELQKRGWAQADPRLHGVHKEIFGRQGSYHMASLERQGINRYIGTWRLEGGCHIRAIADARSSNSNCRIKHRISICPKL